MQNASYEKGDFRLKGIRHMAHALYANHLSRPSNNKLVPGHGIVVKKPEDNENDVQCNYSKRVRHLIHECIVLGAKERRHERDMLVEYKHASFHKRRNGRGKSCTLHNSTTHSDAESRT